MSVINPSKEPRPRPRRRPPSLLLGAIFFAACSSPGGIGPTRSTGDITRAELDGTSFLNTYAAIARLRPAWVRPRAAPSFSDSPAYPLVYVDGIVRGDIQELEALPVSEVQSLRYLSPSDATTRFGTGHTAGAILVTTDHR